LLNPIVKPFVDDAIDRVKDEINKPIRSLIDDVINKLTMITGPLVNEKVTKTVDLDDEYLLQLLAACAKDCYEFEKARKESFNSHLIELTDKRQVEDITKTKNHLQFGVYKIKRGKHKYKTIMAYRGTNSAKGFLQDLTLVNIEAFHSITGISHDNARFMLLAILERAVKKAKEIRPDFICGHSLGAFIAECVCTETGFSGAAFNGPAPYAHKAEDNYVLGDQHHDVPFEVHQTSGDPVSHFGNPGAAHIGKPKWKPKESDPIYNHNMDKMIKEVGELKEIQFELCAELMSQPTILIRKPLPED